jgi:hypothetical protein
MNTSRCLQVGVVILIILYSLPFSNVNFNIVQAEDSGFTVEYRENTFFNTTLLQGSGVGDKLKFQSYGNYSGYVTLSFAPSKYFSARLDWNNPVYVPPNGENYSAFYIQCSSTTPLGKYNLTLVCSDGTLTVNFPIYVNVVKNPYTTTPPPTVTQTVIVTQTTVSPITLTTTSYLTTTQVKIVNVTVPFIINQTKTETRTLTNTVTQTLKETETRIETTTTKETYTTTLVETKGIHAGLEEWVPVLISLLILIGILFLFGYTCGRRAKSINNSIEKNR